MAKSLKNMMGAGIGAGTATLINGTVADALIATGSVQSDALVLTNDVNVIGFVSAGTGVRLLANPQPGDEVLISNLGLNALLVYPPIGATISGGSVNSPLSLPAGATAEFVARTGSANWVSLSSGVTVVAPAGLATPTLTNSSALGATPLVLSVSDTDYTAGLYLQLQIDQTSSAFSNLTQNLVFLVDGASWSALDEAVGLVTPPGQYWARVRAVRDNESGLTTVTGTDPDTATISFLADVSSWSTTFTDTIIPSLTAEWSATDHSTWTTMTLATVNATNDSITATANGANASIRSGNSFSTGKLYIRFIAAAAVGAQQNKIGFATATYGTSGTIASVGDTLANFSQTIFVQGTTLYRGNDGSTNGTSIAVVFASAYVTGDIIDLAVDFGAGKYWFGKNGDFSGHGDPVAGTGGSTNPFAVPIFAFAGIFAATNGDVNTFRIDTKASAASHAPTGYTAAGA